MAAAAGCCRSPLRWGRLAAALRAPLEKPPVTPAQIALMRRDNTVGAGVAGFTDLGIKPHSAVAMGLV
ncbi:hypothetical protein RA22_20310 [Leisingera sp. ANG-S]|nr:hypothetical protein RA22_20310 [Leisingera sp. ANG-S]